MQLRFNVKRTTQAVAELLRAQPAQRMNYMRLLKILYIADREMLAQHAHPITGDQAVAMKRGPVLSQTYDLILGKTKDALWTKCVKTEHYEVVLLEDPGRGQLSKDVLDKLQELTLRYQDKDEWEMSEETHAFEEWQRCFPPSNSVFNPIRWEDALIAQGKQHLIAEVEKDERASALFDEMCGR
ncbi:MAG TPA: Panacea domain-containing protein [Gemmataceae bacterium]|nr:Panacea domain-containing protein [Gemmataceae bacterium]